MKRLGFVLWGLVLMSSLFMGISANQTEVTSGDVLSAQDHPRLSSFPIRRPGSADYNAKAKYAILLDAGSFYPLFQKEAYQPVPIASTTKMMTALVVLEKYKLDDVVTISRKAVFQIGSSTGFLPGETLTVRALVQALLIQSGNDAAYALAEFGGSVDEFVARMNSKAKEVGMNQTSFRDPAGLDDEGRSTAFDLAILAANLLRDETLAQIVKTKEMTISSTDSRHTHNLKNSNRLLTDEMYFPGILGLKTGFTPAAGHTLVSAAERDGHTLISVVLFTYDDTTEASARESGRLLSWGFDNHVWVSP